MFTSLVFSKFPKSYFYIKLRKINLILKDRILYLKNYKKLFQNEPNIEREAHNLRKN